MAIRVISQDEGIEQIAHLFINKNLIPIFGSGFTKGCASFKSNVPDGSLATSIMRDLILENCLRMKSSDLEGKDFNEISKYFYKFVPSEIRSIFFRDYFTQVNIVDYRTELLELPWSYAYTLNIDDGIERTKTFQAVLPYKNLKRPDSSIKLLYKLHGDAFTEVTYQTDENIIFSHEQYLQSITSEQNTDLHNNLVGDYSQRNLLFIGCSLINEPDLKYVYGKTEDTNSTFRIYITSNEISFMEETNLEEYGVNLIVKINDYELFYRGLINKAQLLLSESEDNTYKYSNPSVIQISDRDNTIELISGKKIFDEKENTFYKSGLHVIRSIINEIEESLEINRCIVIKGRRFSGKTFIMCSLLERIKKYTLFFFPSTILVDEQLIHDLFNKYERSLFVFDSNSLSTNTYRYVSNSLQSLKDKNNRIIISVNSNDNHLLDKLNSETFEVLSYFDEEELKISKTLSNEFGLINRRRGNTNIDYLMRLSEEQKITIAFTDFSKKLTNKEKMIILLLCVFDKVYMTDAYALAISPREIREFTERFPTLIEEIPVDLNESNTHSAYKIVHNSKIALLSMLRHLSKSEIIESINEIVSKYQKDKQRRRMYTEVILFDTLNQLFGVKKGAGDLIFQVYESLEKKLSYDMHYWLQRAKSIYRLFYNNKEKLEEAYNFAKKAYIDGTISIKYKAALTTSLIAGLLYDIESDEKAKYYNQREAIMLGYEALYIDLYFNYKHIKSDFLERKTRESSSELLMRVCDDYMNQYPGDDLVNKASKIRDKLLKLKEQYENKKETLQAQT